MTTCGATRYPTFSLEDDVRSGNNDKISFLQETRMAASICLHEEEQRGGLTTMPTYWKIIEVKRNYRF